MFAAAQFQSSFLFLLLLLMPLTGCFETTQNESAPVPVISSALSLSTSGTTPITFTLTGTNGQSHSVLTYAVMTQPTNGTLTGTPPTLTYTANAHYYGVDSFKYTATDGVTTSPPAVVTISVANEMPVAVAESLNISGTSPTVVTLQGSSPDGNALGFSVVQAPLHGSLTGTPPSVTYTANAQFYGADSFTYVAKDGELESPPATVTLNVFDTAPVSSNEMISIYGTTPQGIVLVATDINSSNLSYLIATPPSHGTLTGTPPNVSYTAKPQYYGPDSFSFVASDGVLSSSVGTVTIQVMDTAPVATGQNVALVGSASKAMTLLATDANSDPLTYSIATNPTNGTLTGTPPNVVYKPNPNYFGNDSFTFTASDGTLTSSAATVSITITDVAPTGLVYSSMSPVFIVGNAANDAPKSTGGAIVSYGISAPLPQGLNFSTSTGIISGTPLATSAATTYVVTATNSGGSTNTSLLLAVNSAAPTGLSYSVTAPTYTKGSPIPNNTPSNSGGAITKYVVSPALPAGLNLDPSSGIISGTPTQVVSSASYKVTGSNTTGSSPVTLQITVNDAAPSNLSYTVPASFFKGLPIGNLAPTASGGAVVSYQVSPSLPSGLVFDNSTGVISGTPTVLSQAAPYAVTATNSGGTATTSLLISVVDQAPSVLTYTSPAPTYVVEAAIPANAPSNTGGPILQYSVSPTLPEGLTLDPNSGVISGTPTAITPLSTFTITGSNATGAATAQITITVNGAASGPTIAAGGGGVINVTSYGALPNGSDAQPGIQSAITAACANNAGGVHPPVFVPQGTFSLGSSIVISCTGLDFVGASRTGTILAPQFQGPAILMNPYNGPLTLSLGATLVPGEGTGNSLAVVDKGSSLVLSDAPNVAVDGLSAFTVEAYFKDTTGNTGKTNSIVSSFGIFSNNSGLLPTQSSAFSLAVNAYGYASGEITINGKQYQLSSNIPIDTNTHHVALSYDGSNIRFYYDGVQTQITAATGKINQNFFEDISVGDVTFGLENGAYLSPITGFVDDVRISNIARYTAPSFALPAQKYAPDANTIVLANFEAQKPGVALVHTGSTGTAWIPIRQTAGIKNLGSTQLHNFTVTGGMGIYGWYSQQARLNQISCISCDYGFFMAGDSWGGHFDDLYASASASPRTFGLYAAVGNGNEYNNITLVGQQMPVVLLGGANHVLTNLSVTPNNLSPFALFASASMTLLNGITVNATTANPNPNWIGSIIVSGSGDKFQVQNGNIGNMSNPNNLANPGIPMIIDGGYGAMVENTAFTGTSGAPAVLYVNAATTKPNVVVASTEDSTVPWSNVNVVSLPAPNPFTLPNPAIVPSSSPGSPVVLGNVPATQVFDITHYNSQTPNVDGAGMQNAIDAACTYIAGNGGTATVFIPAGVFTLNQPPVVNCDGLNIVGAGSNSSLINPKYVGPSLVMNPKGMTGMDLGASLVGSDPTEHSMKTDGGSYWIELRDSPAVDFFYQNATAPNNPIPNFTAEAFIKMTAPPAPGSYAGIVQSNGCLGSKSNFPGCTSAFRLGIQGAESSQNNEGFLYGSLTLSGSGNPSGTTYVLTGTSPVSLNTVHHVAITYDGSEIRLFCDGNLSASATPASTDTIITQRAQEDVTVGPETAGFDSGVQAPAIAGFIDGVRLSKNARYIAAPFTIPSQKPAFDSNTLVVLNFSSNPTGMTLGNALSVLKVTYDPTTNLVTGRTVSNTPFYFPIRRLAEPDGTPESTLSNIHFSHFKFSGAGIIGMHTTNAKFEQLQATSADYGISLNGTNTGTIFNEVYLVASGFPLVRGRYGFQLINASNTIQHNVTLSLQETPLVVFGGVNHQYSSNLLQPSGQFYPSWPAVFIQSDDTIQGLYFDNESSNPNWVGDIALWNPVSFSLFKAEVDAVYNASPDVTLEGGTGNILFDGATFQFTENATEILHVISQPNSEQITFQGSYNENPQPSPTPPTFTPFCKSGSVNLVGD